MLKLKHQYFGHMINKKRTHWKRSWCWERLRAGEEGGDRGWDGWMASSTQWAWVWLTPGAADGQGGLMCCSPWGSQRVIHDWETELTDWCPIFLHLERISRKELDHHSKKWSDSYRRNMVMKEIQLYLYVLRLQITIPETLSPICFSWICVSSSSDITG